MIRVIVADDHAIVRDGLADVIAAQPDMKLSGLAKDGAELLDLLSRVACHVTIVDLSLPDINGIGLIRQITKRFAARIVVFSMYPEDQLALHLINSGAAAYLNKSRSPKDLMDAVRAAATGRRYLTEGLETLSILEPGLPATAPELPHHRLSVRESQVFLLLVEGRGVSDIAGELEVTVGTASNHVAAVKKKLGATTIGEVVRYAARIGLLEPTEPTSVALDTNGASEESDDG